MAADDQRQYIEFFGVYLNDWPVTFGDFSNHKYLLDQEYVSDACSTVESSEASVTHEFLYPDHIKKTYHIEGVVRGHITLVASGCTSTVTSFKVSVYKTFDGVSSPAEELATTGWKTVDDTLPYENGVGEEMVYHYRMDVWEKKTITEHERIFIRIEVKCDSCTHLMHANDSKWEDVWIDIPFRM